MMNERSRSRAKVARIRERESLHHLVGHAERLELINGRVVVRDKLPPPVDEHGIPRVELMLEGLLGQMATKAYMWTGAFDMHHMATPKADFTVAHGNIGREFRGISALKVDMPRQMHNLAHILFNLPAVTSRLVMEQALLEVGQARALHAITREKVDDPDKMMSAAHDALYDMTEPRVNMMPSLEVLADMELDELRRTVASLVGIRRYREKRCIHPALRPQSLLRQKAA